MGSQAVLFYGVLLPEPDEDTTPDEILQRATGTWEACKQAKSFDPCAKALAKLGVEAVLVGSDNDDNCTTALAVKGSIRKGYEGKPSWMKYGLPVFDDQWGITLSDGCEALGLSMDTGGWYLTVANV